jgi:hypothetical protein
MTRLGMEGNGRDLPPQFSVAWCGPGEVLPGHGPGYEPGWPERIPGIDPFHDTHPIPPNGKKTYLYDGAAHGSYIMNLVVETFGLDTATKRIFTGK